MKSWILDLVFLSSNYVIDNATIFGLDSCVDISVHFPIKIHLPLLGDKSLTQLTIERRNLDKINIEIPKININLTTNSDRISTTNLSKDPVQVIENRTKFIFRLLFNEIYIQAPKVIKILIK